VTGAGFVRRGGLLVPVDAGEPVQSAEAAELRAGLADASEHLTAALTDFNTRDGAVADAVADTGGNVASEEVLVG
jgi:hypothetical protein